MDVTYDLGKVTQNYYTLHVEIQKYKELGNKNTEGNALAL